jgi:ABC-2 type transport system permease protein
MRGLFAVYKREVALYFRSFIAYAIAFAVLGIIGLLFTANIVFLFEQSTMQQMQYGQSAPIQLTPLVSQNMGIITFLMFLIAPLLTMRLLAEESREGTLEVLMTLPMPDWAFVLGKFLAAWTLFTALLALTLVHTGMLAAIGSFNGGQVFFIYLGTWLYGGATLAIAFIWSSITEDQLVAAFLGAASILTLYLANALATIITNQQNPFGDVVGEFVRQLGLNVHYDNMLDGIIRAQDVLYFVLLIIVALFITTLIVGTRRWRAS